MTSLLASEIYLLERWDKFPDFQPTERRAKIFEEYIGLGVAGRWPYHQAARSGNHQASQAQFESIIEASRTTHERQIARIILSRNMPVRRVWARISYQGPDLLDQFEDWEVGSITGQDDSRVLVLNDASRYSYSAAWERVLWCLPEIADGYYGPRSPERHQFEIKEAKDDCEPELENEVDEEGREEIREQIQSAWVTGCFWIQDDEAIESNEALFLWIDEYGRVVREGQFSAEEAITWSGMFERAAEIESPLWTSAEIGAEYEGGNWP